MGLIKFNLCFNVYLSTEILIDLSFHTLIFHEIMRAILSLMEIGGINGQS